MRQRGGKLDTRINEQIEKPGRCGAVRTAATLQQLCFADIEKLAVSSMCESGEVFIRMVRQKFGRSKVNFALEVLEADQLDEDYNSPATKHGNVWKLGVELDKFGRPVSYAFLSRHPGDTAFQHGNPASVTSLFRQRMLSICLTAHLHGLGRPVACRGLHPQCKGCTT